MMKKKKLKYSERERDQKNNGLFVLFGKVDKQNFIYSKL